MINVWPLKAIFAFFTILRAFVSKLTKNLSQISQLKVHANRNNGIETKRPNLTAGIPKTPQRLFNFNLKGFPSTSALGEFNVWPLKAIFAFITIQWAFVKNLQKIYHN